MLKSLDSRELHIAAIVAGGIVALFGILYGPISSFAIGGADWAFAFRNGARGDYTFVVTPYWSLFLSFLPAHLPEPYGYIFWISAGAFLVLVTAHFFKAPLLAVVLSYQMSWILYYGQIDPFVIFGIGLGYYATIHKKPLLGGVAIALMTIKPQVTLLLATYYFLLSSSKTKTALTFLSIAGASLLAWPGWPARLLFEQILVFLSRAQNSWANTSLGLPLWAGGILALVSLAFPLNSREKIPFLLAVNLLISPYSTIYSQLALLAAGLPTVFYLFGFIPWITAITWGAFGHWQWGFIFPLSVALYLGYTAHKRGDLISWAKWRENITNFQTTRTPGDYQDVR